MKKLIDAYRASPSEKGRARIRAHLAKHPFCLVMLDEADVAFLQSIDVGA